MNRYLFLLLFLVSSAVNVNAYEPFVVSDIRVEGLQRISAASLFSSMPINVGDRVTAEQVRGAVRNLFRTGNFDDIEISRDGAILVVVVIERPSISEINIEGNKAIDTESLLEGLKGSGLADGKVFKRSTLESMKMELTSQYVSQGRYDAGIETDVVALPRNRVAININVDEGSTASIKHINIVGNSVYGDEALLDMFESKSTGWLSWITSNDKYAKEKITGDIETLTSYYLDRGYINFAVDSTQVSVTPDKAGVYITINVSEDEIFTVGDVDLSGDIVVPEEQLRPLIFIRKGQIFSQVLITSSEEWITKRLGNDGYNFAKVEGVTEINEEDKTVNLKFFIDPGKRTYVRRISFAGNTRTADEVLRREMRQMEAAPASSINIEQSRVRLERLGFFKEAAVETLEVPGSDDLIDLDFTVEEQSSGSIGASLGFSQDAGLLLGANIQEDNFLGTGNQIGISVNKSDYMTNLRFSFVDPFFTKDGVSRGFSIFYREADLSKINVSRYTTNSYGTSLNFGYPINETERLGFSLGYSNTEITAGIGAVQEISASPRLRTPIEGNYASYYEAQGNAAGLYDAPEILMPLYDDNGDILQSVIDSGVLTSPESLGFEPGFIDKNGDSFNNFTLSASWSKSTLNRGRMATRGSSQNVSLELTVPGSDLEYFKLTYTGEIFLPISREWIVRLRTELGYGDGFGKNDALPFFNHFYAGGFGSVRGFKSNTLGPRSTSALYYPSLAFAVTDIVEVGDSNCPSAVDNGSGIEVCEDGQTLVGSASAFSNKVSYTLPNGASQLPITVYDRDADPFGGNVLFEAGAELLFPLPFIKDRRSIRSAFFIDVGNVFSSNCGTSQLNCFEPSFDDLRYSYGIGVSWITGMGPLTFSYAKPVNDSDEDEIEAFQFSLGRSF
ncbi:MAG: outer membrane protein insertion porin family [Paraglaciecola psychrophila]|jgi:outer membrane protein insertion porin family